MTKTEFSLYAKYLESLRVMMGVCKELINENESEVNYARKFLIKEGLVTTEDGYEYKLNWNELVAKENWLISYNQRKSCAEK